MSKPLRVFLSYSHKDKDFLASLNEHLALLRREGAIEIWQDREIVPGQDWEKEIVEALAAADMILLLISSALLASEFCFGREMEIALARHKQGSAQLVPILLRPCDWESAPFANLQMLPSDAKPVSDWTSSDHAYRDIAKGLRKALADLRILRSAQAQSSEQPPNVIDAVSLAALAAGSNNDRRQFLGEKIGMSLKNADLVETLRSVAKLSSLNILIHSGVRGGVTAELKAVPWDQAFEQILKISGLRMEVEDNIVRVLLSS